VLDDLTYHEPKAEQLETLKEFGIDVSFLDAFEPGAAQRVENIQSLLDYIADLIPKLRNGSDINNIRPYRLFSRKEFYLYFGLKLSKQINDPLKKPSAAHAAVR